MTTPFRRFALPSIVALVAAGLLIAVATTVGAQTPGDETPIVTSPTGELIPTSTEGTPVTADETAEADATPTEEPTPGPEVQTLVKLQLGEGVEQPISEGDEFVVQVLVQQVEHLAGFEFAIGYDPDKIEPVLVSPSQQATPGSAETPTTGADLVKVANLGQVLLSGGRDPSSILCSDPRAVGSTATATCSILGAPVCAGGQPGVSGDGLLAAVSFKAKGGGLTHLDVSKSTLVLDDVAPPCPQTEEDDFQIQTIPHRREGLDIDLKADEGSNMLLIVGIIVVAAVVVVGAGGGYMFYRQRQGPSA